MYKKILSLLTVFLSLLLINGCEKDFNTVIDAKLNDIQILSVAQYNKIVFNSSDSAITLSIKFISVKGLKIVLMNIYSPSNEIINDIPIELLDNGNISANGDTTAGDLTYSNKFLLSSNFENGPYNIEYIIVLNDGTKKNVASQHFIFDNGKSNLPPVLSDLIQPDTVQTDNRFTFSVLVTDPDGLLYIKEVFYELFKPDGTKITNSQGISKFPLFDNGNTASNGDAVAGDGRYTVFLTFPNSVPKGKWKFDFTATDKAGHSSNTISHNVELK